MLFEIMILQHKPEYDSLGEWVIHSLVRIPFPSLSINILNFFFTFPASPPHPFQMHEYFIFANFKLLRYAYPCSFSIYLWDDFPADFSLPDFGVFFVARYLYQREFLVISTMVFKIEGSFPCLRLWRLEMGREEIDIPLI